MSTHNICFYGEIKKKYQYFRIEKSIIKSYGYVPQTCFIFITCLCFVIQQAAAEKVASLDQGMQYPAEVGVNAYVRVKLSFLGQQVSTVSADSIIEAFCPVKHLSHNSK